MAYVVPCIVEVSMNKIALWISNRGNDWRAESAMIASNDTELQMTVPDLRIQGHTPPVGQKR